MWIVEKKLSKIAIPIEYGFTHKKDAEKFKSEIKIEFPVRWTDLKEKEKPTWDQFEFVK